MSENNQNYLTERIVDGKIAKSSHEMKAYLDDKPAETKGDILKALIQ